MVICSWRMELECCGFLFNEFEEAFGKLTGDDRVEELSVATAKLAYPYIDRDGTADAGEISGVEDPYVLYQK